nr:UDP-3-O-(3-hydroxymyristoyl)glucosamine N-acyltransferase [Burkholderiales bacterium]
MPRTLAQLVDRLGGELIGPADTQVRQVAPLESARADEIAFLTGGRWRKLLDTTGAAAVILAPAERDATSLPRIVTPNPYAYAARVLALLNPRPTPVAGRHATASVDATADVHPSAQIGPHVVVAAGARIGARAYLGPHCIVGEAASIGDDTWCHARVTVYAGCHIGARGILHAGVVIGADGFGMAEDEGRWIKVPQIGAVSVGDDVEIGANTTIDRGALADTRIGDGVKMDNQIQIGHNVVIGDHTAIAACVGIAGSTRIGARCRIGGAAMIHGHIDLCDGV